MTRSTWPSKLQRQLVADASQARLGWVVAGPRASIEGLCGRGLARDSRPAGPAVARSHQQRFAALLTPTGEQYRASILAARSRASTRPQHARSSTTHPEEDPA